METPGASGKSSITLALTPSIGNGIDGLCVGIEKMADKTEEIVYYQPR